MATHVEPPKAAEGPLLAPPDVGHEPYNPIRDESKTSPHEDLDRQPDGVPHSIVGMTAFFAVMLALLVGLMVIAGGVTRIAAIVLALLAIPVISHSLGKKSEKKRDHAHPSR